MKFVKIKDNVQAHKDNGFKHGDRIVALLSGSEVKYGTLFFVGDHQTLFEVQLVIDQLSGRSED